MSLLTRHTADLALRAVAVALMLGGAVMIFTTSSSGLAIAIIAVGIGIVAILQIDKACRGDSGVGHGGHAHS